MIKDYFGLGEEAVVASAEEACRACETPVPPGAVECPECGLSLVQEESVVLARHPFVQFLARLNGHS